MDQSHSLRGLLAPSAQTAYIPDQYMVGNSRFVNNTLIAQPPPRSQLIVQPPSYVRPQQIMYQTNAASHQYYRPGPPPPLIFHPRHSRQIQIRPPVTPVQPTPAVMPSAFNINRRPSTLQYFPASQMSGRVPLSHVQCNCICYQSKPCCCYSRSIVPCHGTPYLRNDNIYPQQQSAIFQSCTRQTRYVHQNASHATNNAPGFMVQESRQVPTPVGDLEPSDRPEVLTPTDSDPNEEEEIDKMEAQPPEKRSRVAASPPYSPQSLIIDLDPDFSLSDKLPFEDFVDGLNSNSNNNNDSSCLVTEYSSSNNLVGKDESTIEGMKGIYALSSEILLPQKEDFVKEGAVDCTGAQDGDDTVLDNETEEQQVTHSQSTELNASVAEETLNSSESEGQEPIESGNQSKTASAEEVMEFGISEVSVYETPSPKNDTVEVEELQCADNGGTDDYITLTQEVSSLISVLASSIGSLPPVDDSTNILSPNSLIDSTNFPPLGSFGDSSNSSPDSFNDSSNLLPPDFFIDSSSSSSTGSIDGPSNASPPALMNDSPSNSDMDEPSNSGIDHLSNSDIDQPSNSDIDDLSNSDIDDLSNSDTDDEFSDLSLSLDEDDSSIYSPPGLANVSSTRPVAKSSSPLVISIPLSVLDYDASSDPSMCSEPPSLVVSYPISVWLGRQQKKRNDNSNNTSNSSTEDSKSRLNKILDSSALLSAIDLYIVKGFFLSTLPKMEKEVLRYALTHFPSTPNSRAFYIGIKLNLTTKEWVSFKHYGDSIDIFDNSIHI